MSPDELREYDLYSLSALGYFMLTGENPEGIKDESLDLLLKGIKNKENKKLVKLLRPLSAPSIKKEWKCERLVEKRAVITNEENKAVARQGGFMNGIK